MAGTRAAGPSPSSDLVIVSNRGPAQFRRGADGAVEAGRASGGLASSLASVLSGTGALWIYAAMGDAEREIASSEPGMRDHQGMRLIPLVPDEAVHANAYGTVANSILWFAYHDMFDRVRAPAYGALEHAAWKDYETFNLLFAEAVSEYAVRGATVLVQDYHLHLAGAYLRELRPDLHTVHFVHTPFCEPSGLCAVPDAWARELLSSMACFDSVGFHCERWRAAFLACCAAYGVSAPATFDATLGVDPAPLEEVLASPAARAEAERLDSLVGSRQVIVRVDRVEPSKNLVRGFLAYDMLLETSDLAGRVVFLALAYPSRESLPVYSEYRAAVDTVAADINARHGTADWTPIIFDVKDSFARSVAALNRYDVLLVNPIKDGLNLVAKEGPIVNGRDGLVVLSRHAGVWDELSSVAYGVNPFDLTETRDALAAALSAEPLARKKAAAALRDASEAQRPQDWLAAQLAAVRT